MQTAVSVFETVDLLSDCCVYVCGPWTHGWVEYNIRYLVTGVKTSLKACRTLASSVALEMHYSLSDR